MADPRRAGAAALGAGGAVAVLACAAFAPVLSNGWVWDDRALIVGNGLVAGLDAARLRAMFAAPHLTTYMPLGWLSFALLRRAAGLNPRAFHAATLAAHAACSVLLFWTCRRLFEGKPRALAGAAAAGALFAAHPLQLWTAGWAIELPDALATALYLLCVLAYLGGRGRARLWLCASLFAASLLLRWRGIGLPAVLLALDVWPLRRREPRGTLIKEKLPFFALALAAAAATLLGKRQESVAPLWNLAAPARALCLFARLLAWPFDVKAAYAVSGPGSEWLPAWAAVSLVALWTALLWLRRARWPAAWCAWVCYASALAPTGLAARGGRAFVFPPYGYLASLPAFALAGEAARRLWSEPAAKAALAALLAAYLGASRRACAVFRDQGSFWRAHLLREPGFVSGEVQLADDLIDRGRYSDAWLYVADALVRSRGDAFAKETLARLEREAPGLSPDLPGFWARESRELLALGDAPDAALLCEKALARRPRDPQAHEALADALEAQGRAAEARRHRELARFWAGRQR